MELLELVARWYELGKEIGDGVIEDIEKGSRELRETELEIEKRTGKTMKEMGDRLKILEGLIYGKK